jgi:hypothetical protein
MAETTALGAAMAAGSAEGIEVWDLNNIQPVPCDIFNPLITEDGKKYFLRVFCLIFTNEGNQSGLDTNSFMFSAFTFCSKEDILTNYYMIWL